MFDSIFSILFLLFLLLFMVIGQVPALQRKILQSMGVPPDEETEAPVEEGPPAKKEGWHQEQEAVALDELEYLVLRQLSRAGASGLTQGSLSDQLHLGRERLAKGLKALEDRRMVRRQRLLFARRYRLTDRGRQQAIAQGFILTLRR